MNLCCILKKLYNKILNYINNKLEQNSIQYQLQGSPNKLIDNNGVVVFDYNVNTIGNKISYDNNGNFTILKNGTYIVDFLINISGSDGSIDLKFLLSQTNGINFITSYNLSSVGQIKGQALLNCNVGDILTIYNQSGSQLLYYGGLVQADIRIVKIN